ncbi:MAG TPA: TfoX/Sxy family protein [Dehalococcoidia bacterium]|nr:TfoX/Sxy family protein [Dehalococcoidia bacterium]
MKVSNEYLRFIMQKLDPLGYVTSRAMFGGYGIFHEGLMFALIADDVLYFKVNESSRTMYEQAGSKPFPHGISYWEVPAELLEEDTRLHEWANISIGIARQLSLKKAGRAKRKRD